MKNFFTAKKEFNYLYFSIFLLFLVLLSFLHLKAMQAPFQGLSPLYALYAVVQAALEVSALLFFAYLCKEFFHKIFYLAYICFLFLLMLFHFINFLLARVMDSSIIYAIEFFLGSGIAHMRAGAQALNMNDAMGFLTLLSFFLVPLVGLFCYFASEKISLKRPFKVAPVQIAAVASSLLFSLLVLDYFVTKNIDYKAHQEHRKILPLGTTFLSHPMKKVILPSAIPPFRNEDQAKKLLPTKKLSYRPNIFIFVIETLRKDFLEYAPHLSAFGKAHMDFPESFANASSTHLSWFSLFHANLPLYWADMRQHYKGGSIAIQALKNMGYRLKVFSSADMRFFQMDKLLFGKKRELLDEFTSYCSDKQKPYQRDQSVMQALQSGLEKEGVLHLIFLDSPHSEYSFPQKETLKHLPIVDKVDYFRIKPESQELEWIKNRYKNSIDYIDQLMSQFFQTLKEENLYEDALIAITGDHGEEFFEEGALFHGTHLNQYQTKVPILLKFPKLENKPEHPSITHIDVLPSIFHYLSNQNPSHFKYDEMTDLFDGTSIFDPNHQSIRFAALQNGPRTPIEFSLSSPTCYLQARFKKPDQVEIIELQGSFDPDIFLPILKK